MIFIGVVAVPLSFKFLVGPEQVFVPFILVVLHNICQAPSVIIKALF